MLRSQAKSSDAKPQLSILILSLLERTEKYLLPLLHTLQSQCQGVEDQVEIVVVSDNRWRTIGAKRNEILHLAHGEYITFVDDDDMVSHDYVESILDVFQQSRDEQRSPPDCVVFDVWVRGYDVLNMQPQHGSLCRYGIEFEHQNLSDGTFLRKPNCRMVYRRSLCRGVDFLDVNCGEDDAWGRQVAQRVGPNSQVRIHKIMYFYNWNAVDSEAGGVKETRAELARLGKIVLTPTIATMVMVGQ